MPIQKWNSKILYLGGHYEKKRHRCRDMGRAHFLHRGLLPHLCHREGHYNDRLKCFEGFIMKRRNLLLPLLFTSILCSCSSVTIDEPYSDTHNPFSYAGNYENPELDIDGKDDEEEWKSEWASETYSISYVSKADSNSEAKNKFQADFKLYRGEKELYVFARVTDPNLLAEGNDNGNNVSLSDSVEIYLDTLNDRGESPQTDDYQINLGIHNKTRVLVGNGSGWSSWNGLVQYESLLNGTLNNESDIDTGYSIEMSIPYKQIGINRESKIGIAFGLVDKYSSKTTNSKMWYGLTYKGNFANPQKPDTYFVYDKNTISIPPVPVYDESKDTNTYITSYASMPSAKTDTATHPDIDIGVYRKGDEVTLRLDNKGKGWGDNAGFWFYFDGGKYGKTTRDENSWCIRTTVAGGIGNFFYLGGPNKDKDVAGKAKLTLMVNEQYLMLSCPLSVVSKDYSDAPIAFGIASADLSSMKVMATMKTENGKANMSNPSSFVWIDEECKLYTNEYNPSKDNTPYNEGVGLLKSGTKDNVVDVYRKGNELKIRVKAVDETLISTYALCFYFDGSSKASTSRNNDTWCLRIKLKEKTVKDYFYLGTTNKNKAIPQTGIECNISASYIALSLPLNAVSESYQNKDIGFTASLFTSDLKTLKASMTMNGISSNNSNPSTFAWIDSNNNLK